MFDDLKTPELHKFDEARALEICERIADGESLRAICESPTMPPPRVVCRWVYGGDHPDFEKQYQLARQMQAELIFDELLEIADAAPPQSAEIKKANSRIAVRLQVLSRMQPKRFAERIQVDQRTEHSGKVETDVKVKLSDLSPDMRTKLRALADQAKSESRQNDDPEASG